MPNASVGSAFELSHVALHRAVDGHPVPRWFTEGVSIHQAGERNIARIRTLWQGAVQRRLPQELAGASASRRALLAVGTE